MSVRKVSQKGTNELRIIGTTYGRVNFVHTKTRVVICERCDGWSYPGRRERHISVNVRRVVSVENLNFTWISEQRSAQ